jgi:hypothetical protein
VPAVDEGRASGANNTIREVGGVFGVAVLASVFAANGGYASPQAFVDGLVPAIWVGVVAVALGALVAVAIPATRRIAGRIDVGRLPDLDGGALVTEPVRIRS